ncbi:MAG: RHS repeat-associated core domain-containing protein, partial [Candidatus Omnitrophota bacterium]
KPFDSAQGKQVQDGALKGQIEKVIAYDGNNRKISETINTYEVKKAGPEDKSLGFPALIETESTIWEENNTSLSTKDKLIYDNIGNVIAQENQGDVLKTGDEKTAVTTYAQAYESGFNRSLETTLKDKDGNIITKKNFEYDNKGNLSKEIVWLNTQETQPYIQYSYDSFGNLTTTTNALGSVVTTDYETDFYIYPEKVTNSLGQSISYEYDPRFGVVTKTTDTNSNTSSTTYDSLARVLEVMNAYDQIVTTYNYPDLNTKITTNAIGLFSAEYIDGIGRKYKTVSPGEDGDSPRQVASEVFYNNRGLTEKESLPHYINEDENQIAYIKYEYDIRGRVKKTISDFPGISADAQSSIEYINPLYTKTTDPLGHKKCTLKDIYGNVIQIEEYMERGDEYTKSDGAYHTDYEYDSQNNLIKTVDNQGNITQIVYDSLGRKIKMIDPDMGAWSYEYDLLGNLIKQIDAKGQELTFEYDQLNRLTKKTRDDGRGTRDEVKYIYDDSSKDNCIGRLSKVEDQSSSNESFYDKLGRAIKSVKTIDNEQFTISREYDILNRLTKLIYPDGSLVNYSYDTNSGLLERVFAMEHGLSTMDYIKNTTYNAKGQIKNITYGNGVTTNYTYGQDLRLSRILTQGTSNLQDLNYIFDKNGNLSTLTDNLRNNIRTYNYDGLDRLKEANNLPAPGGGYTNYSYNYDSIGNMTYKTGVGAMSYGLSAGPHAVTSAGGYTYQYDANGNMVIGKNKTLAYDAENRLIQVNESGIITSFIYDGDGGRVKKTVDQDSTIYIGSLFEKDFIGKITNYIFAGANRVASVESTGNTYYYHSDHLGSSNIITDANGNLVQHCEYTPYGSIAVNEGIDIAKHKFTGKELDNTGLYYYSARYYDPEIGRFITPDTIVQALYDSQSLNRYAYCRNNPINYIDPTGHKWSWGNFFKAVGIAIVGIALTMVSGGALTPFIGSYWAGVTTGAFAGATMGGGFAAATGGNIGMGLLTGAVGGAVFAGLAPGLGTFSNGIFRGVTLGGAAGPLTPGVSITSNFTASFLCGAASGAAVAGISGADVGKTALMGGVIAGGFSLGRDVSLLMRAKMVDQSRLDPRNSSGKSVGFDGDNFKLGGGRYDPVHPNGNPSPLGGAQGGVGQIFGLSYKPSSIWDRIIETYAGPHDYLNSWGYDLFGNLKNQSGFEGFLGATLNPLNVVIATPIAVSSTIPRVAYSAPSVIYGQSTDNDKY